MGAAAGSTELRQAIQRALTREAGAAAEGKALAGGFVRVYDMLAGQLAPLIGDGGVQALTARSLHLVQEEFPWLAGTEHEDPSAAPFAKLGSCLERQDQAAAAAAAAAALGTLGGLLETLIGEALTMRVVRAAWPGAFPGESGQEGRET